MVSGYSLSYFSEVRPNEARSMGSFGKHPSEECFFPWQNIVKLEGKASYLGVPNSMSSGARKVIHEKLIEKIREGGGTLGDWVVHTLPKGILIEK